MRSGWLWFIAFVALFGALIVYLNQHFPDALASQDSTADLTYYSILLVAIGSSILVSFRGRLGEAAKYGIIWGLIFLICIVLFSYREPMKRVYEQVRSEILPSSARMTTQGEVAIQKSMNGHFYIDAEVNGQPVQFMVDTGASRITFSYEQAQRLGLDRMGLEFNQITSTANGQAVSAPITLDAVSIGNITLYDIPASVTQKGAMDGALLGMSFLERLGSFRMEGNTLYLKE